MGKGLLAMLLFGGAASLFTADARAAVLINEVLADPSGDADGDGVTHATKDEFVELVNTGPAAVSLDSWTIADSLQIRHTFVADAVIPARGFIVRFGGLALNNTGDTVSLRDAAAQLVDSFTFGAEGGQDSALTRSPDGEGAFVLHTTVGGLFSPGTTATGLAQLPLLSEPDPEPVFEPQPPVDSYPEPEPALPLDDLPDEPASPVVPEPSTLWLLGAGLASATRLLRRKACHTKVGHV